MNVEEATERFQEATEAAERWRHQVEQRAVVLKEAEENLGQSVLSGVEPGTKVNKSSTTEAVSSAGQHLADLRAELDAAKAAASEAVKVIDTAQRDVWRAEAAELREEAAGIMEQAEEQQAFTDTLLAELREHEGVNFVVEPPKRAQPGEMQFIPVAKSQLLRDEAAKLQQRAAALESKADDTPARRAQEKADREQAHQDWLAWEREQFEKEQKEHPDLANVNFVLDNSGPPDRAFKVGLEDDA